MRDELRVALSLLRVRQVREFVLITDARVDAAAVTARSSQSQAFAMDVDATVDFAGDGVLDDHFSFTLASNWLFRPAILRRPAP